MVSTTSMNPTSPSSPVPEGAPERAVFNGDRADPSQPWLGMLAASLEVDAAHLQRFMAAMAALNEPVDVARWYMDSAYARARLQQAQLCAQEDLATMALQLSERYLAQARERLGQQH